MGNTAAVVSLDALVTEAGQALGAARSLFGPAPSGGQWTSTPVLADGHRTMSGLIRSAERHFGGAGGQTYAMGTRDLNNGLGSIVSADYHTTPGFAGSVRVVSNGREGVDTVIGQTQSGVDAIAPSAATPAGRAALIKHLQGQLADVRAVLVATEQRNASLAAMIRAASAGYSSPMGGAMAGGGAFGGGGGGGGLPLSGLNGLAGFAGRHGPGARGHSAFAGHHGAAIGGGGPTAQLAVKAALTKLGRPYIWGAKGPDAFDCSGLVHWAYAQAGITMGADTYHQIAQGAQVAPGDVQAGDIIFPRSSFDSRGPGHVMLAISATQCVEAQTTGVPVKISPMPGSFVARRVA